MPTRQEDLIYLACVIAHADSVIFQVKGQKVAVGGDIINDILEGLKLLMEQEADAD